MQGGAKDERMWRGERERKGRWREKDGRWREKVGCKVEGGGKMEGGGRS